MMVVESLSRSEIAGEITYNYFYRLVKGQVSLPSVGKGIIVQSYGIEIERQDVLSGEVTNIERDCLESISPQRHKVHNLLRLLYDKEVSPIHLIDVLGEYIDEYIIDFDGEFTPQMATN
jgi:hypothetical protein